MTTHFPHWGGAGVDSGFRSPWNQRGGSAAPSDFSAAAVLNGIFPEATRARLGPNRIRELNSLSRETNPEIFYESLLQFGECLAVSGEGGEALRVFAALRDQPALAPRAAERFEALQGQGSGGLRTEWMLRSFSRQALDPTMLVGMGAASAVFRLTRVAALARLSSSAAPGLVTRAIGAGNAASLLAFGAEAALFPFATRLAATAFGREVSWERGRLASDVASSFLTLGAMRLSGLAVNRVPGKFGQSEAAQSLASFGGLMLGHQVEVWAGLRAPQAGAQTLVDSLAMLLQFRVAGHLLHQVMGPGYAAWERALDARAEAMTRGARPSWDFTVPGWQALAATASRAPQLPARDPLELFHQPMQMAMKPGETTSTALAPMGIRLSAGGAEVLTRRKADSARLAELLPAGRIDPARLEDLDYLSEILNGFGVTTHRFDLASFRSGLEIARAHPDRIANTAWDVDEVILHWSIGLADVARGLFSRERHARYHHAGTEILNYDPFRAAEDIKPAWYRPFLKGRMRQNVQFHPGVRAFQLGLRLGLGRNLVMVTTGPAGKILMLANEDPAMRMIYFGRMPDAEVRIHELREASNIYTREHLALAMREVLEGENQYPDSPLVRDYIERLQRYPSRGVKFKHPAIATLLGKRPFQWLVDDSGSTMEMFRDSPHLVVIQPPSARTTPLLNFVFFRRGAYLNRMSNGYVQRLAEALAMNAPPKTQSLKADVATPADYPHQRLAIEMPWDSFYNEYLAPAREMRELGRRIGSLVLPNGTERLSSRFKPNLDEASLQGLGWRLQRELDLWTEGSGTTNVVRTLTIPKLRQEIKETADGDLNAYLAAYFSGAEMARIPESAKPASERSDQYYARVAGLIAAKRAALRLLNLSETHALDLEYRFGRPLVTGKVSAALGDRILMLSTTRDGNAGIGVALLENSAWDSGLLRIGIDLTNDRVQYTTPLRHALAEATHKAVFQGYGPADPKQFNAARTAELDLREDGYWIAGRMAAAARVLSGEIADPSPLAIKSFHLRSGSSLLTLVGIPTRQTAAGPRALPPAATDSEAAVAGMNFFFREIKSKVEAALASGEFPEYPLPETERALIATGFAFNRDTLRGRPTTMEAILAEYIARFAGEDYAIETLSATEPRHSVLRFTASKLEIHLKEIEHQDDALLHIEEKHLVDGGAIPLHEEIRFRLMPQFFPSGFGDPMPVEAWLRGAGLPDAATAEPRLRQMLAELPPGPHPLEREEHRISMVEFVDNLMSGRSRYRRLEWLHRFLAAGRPLEDLRVVDNGPGTLPVLSYVLARLGSHVLVKDPDPLIDTHRNLLFRFGAEAIRSRIHYAPADRIHQIDPADIVYWSNPDPTRLLLPSGTMLEEYLTRDVKPGGYFVMQTDHHGGSGGQYLNLPLDAAKWERILAFRLPNRDDMTNNVLPTSQFNDIHLQIWRRRLDPKLEAEIPVDDLPFPYLSNAAHRYELPKTGMKVAVLGDVGAVRTINLARAGHHVLHYDFDDMMLGQAARRMRNDASEPDWPPTAGEPRVEFILANWYGAKADADYVEAYFPLNVLDIPQSGESRELAIRSFIARALNTKLAPGGVAYVVSEQDQLIMEMAKIVQSSKEMQLLDMRFHLASPELPLIGGYAATTPFPSNSYLIYRRQ